MCVVDISGGRSRGSRRGSKVQPPGSAQQGSAGGDQQAKPGEFDGPDFGEFGDMDGGLTLQDQMDDLQSNMDQIR